MYVYNEYMGIFTYAYDISLLCMSYPFWNAKHVTDYVKSMPLVTNLPLIFNATKSQLLYFSYLDKDHSTVIY